MVNSTKRYSFLVSGNVILDASKI